MVALSVSGAPLPTGERGVWGPPRLPEFAVKLNPQLLNTSRSGMTSH
jgi:hypothetical protein